MLTRGRFLVRRRAVEAMTRGVVFEPHPDWTLALEGAVPLGDAEVSAVLADLRYKPYSGQDWRFSLTRGKCVDPLCFAHIEVELPDMITPGDMRPFLYHLRGFVYSPAQLRDAIGQGIADIETHEFREGFLYQGQHVIDPHPPDGNFWMAP